jgi:hypothetical protein
MNSTAAVSLTVAFRNAARIGDWCLIMGTVYRTLGRIAIDIKILVAIRLARERDARPLVDAKRADRCRQFDDPSPRRK